MGVGTHGGIEESDRLEDPYISMRRYTSGFVAEVVGLGSFAGSVLPSLREEWTPRLCYSNQLRRRYLGAAYLQLPGCLRAAR